jgi:HD superfamily phosphohydrolase YqeK
MKSIKESKIREYFDFYQKKVLPEVEKLATQKKEGYHGLHTHTDAVVFRAIDYALELGENPMPVLFAAACHDMARTHDDYDEMHGENALPMAQKIMHKFKNELTDLEKQSVLLAIKDHTTGGNAGDYISACLWDADRTRLSWERGYREVFFNTEYGKKVASGDAKKYITWQNKVLGRTNKDREGNQTICLTKEKEDLLKLIDRLKTHQKQ